MYKTLHHITVKFFLIVFCFVAISGCDEDQRDDANITPPDGILSRTEFVALMADIQLIEAAAKNRVFRNDDVEKRLSEAYLEILEKHSISKASFEISHTWWWEHPVAMKGVLLEVTERLNQIEVEDI